MDAITSSVGCLPVSMEPTAHAAASLPGMCSKTASRAESARIGPEPMAKNLPPPVICHPAYCDARQARTGSSVVTCTAGPPTDGQGAGHVSHVGQVGEADAGHGPPGGEAAGDGPAAVDDPRPADAGHGDAQRGGVAFHLVGDAVGPFVEGHGVSPPVGDVWQKRSSREEHFCEASLTD